MNKFFGYGALLSFFCFFTLCANQQQPIIITPSGIQFPHLVEQKDQPQSATPAPNPTALTSFISPTGKPEIRGCIKMHDSSTKVPEFRVLFDGKETMSSSEGFFSFPIDEENLEELTLVICSSITQNFDKTNTLKNISIPPENKYRSFVLKRNDWGNLEQREKQLDKKNRIIPAQSIVILMHPSTIKNIEPWNLELPKNIVKLPVIVLKDTIKSNKITRASAKSLLYSLDAMTFHEPIKETVQKQPSNPKVAISLTQ